MSITNRKEAKSIRRHDIDWLRVILFGLLIPFHVAIGIYWSTYGAEINPNFDEIRESNQAEFVGESNDYSSESVSNTSMILHWMHQWRLAALFMISGMGTSFAFRSRPWKKFLKERCQRLLIPMFFGAWTMGFAGSVILGEEEMNPVGLSISFFSGIIWRSLIFWIPIFGKIIALGHLWFLWNLFQYSLIMTPIFHLISNNPEGQLARAIQSLFTIRLGLGILLLLPLILVLTEVIFKPFFPGFVGVGYEWLWFLVFFAFGYFCITAKDQYYEFIEKYRIIISLFTILLTVAFVWLRLEQHSSGIPYVDGGWLEDGIFHSRMTLLACLVHSFHAWFWCLTLFSWAALLLNKPSNNLAYMNQAVYPFYIVHMPLTFAGLKLSSEFELNNYPAVIASSSFVVLFCWVFFEMVRRSETTRFLFGIKSSKKLVSPEKQI